MAENSEVGIRSQLALGTSLILIAVTAQGIIIVPNVGYISHNFSVPVMLAYLAAATGLILMPWIIQHLHAPRLTKTVFVGFCSWITLEENLHASNGWHAPAGATQVLGMVFPTDTAKGITLLAFVLLVFGVIETLAHLGHCGASMCIDAHKKLPHKTLRHK